MYSLHWICALTLALVCYLSAQPVKRDADDQRELLEMFGKFRTLIENEADCPDDTTLYSPNVISQDCLSSALNCVVAELEVLGYECNITKNDSFINFSTSLNWTDWKFPSNSRKCDCEDNTTDVETFLNNIKNLLEQLNTVATP